MFTYINGNDSNTAYKYACCWRRHHGKIAGGDCAEKWSKYAALENLCINDYWIRYVVSNFDYEFSVFQIWIKDIYKEEIFGCQTLSGWYPKCLGAELFLFKCLAMLTARCYFMVVKLSLRKPGRRSCNMLNLLEQLFKMCSWPEGKYQACVFTCFRNHFHF